MYRIIFLFLFLPSFLLAQSPNLREEVEKPINAYIEGTSYNYPERILEGFMPGAQMFLSNSADTLMIFTVEKYAALYDNGRRGQQNQRFSKLVSLDIVEDIAYAKLEVDIPSYNSRYFDLILLKKLEGEWKIISKAATDMPLPRTPLEAKPNPSKEVTFEGLKKPWSMAFINENDVLIAEKDGGLVHLNIPSKDTFHIQGLPEDIAGEVHIDTSQHPSGTFPSAANGSFQSYNAGLFQVLLDPDFANNNDIYLSYAAENNEKASALKVVKGKLVDQTFTLTKTILLAGPYSHGLFHYGGGMAIGADKHLYITTGERNLFEHNNPDLPLAQDLKDKRGKVFRFALDGSVPSDNPTFPEGSAEGLYALGIRAAQGIALDPETKELWFSDHGTIQGDELNILKTGVNYGWPYRSSGKYRSKDYSPKMDPSLKFESPIHYWDQTIAPTGLTFYYGREFPQWHGSAIVPGLSKGSLWRLEINEHRVVGVEELFPHDRVRSRKAVVSPRGYLYILTDEENGKLIKVVNSPRE